MRQGTRLAALSAVALALALGGTFAAPAVGAQATGTVTAQVTKREETYRHGELFGHHNEASSHHWTITSTPRQVNGGVTWDATERVSADANSFTEGEYGCGRGSSTSYSERTLASDITLATIHRPPGEASVQATSPRSDATTDSYEECPPSSSSSTDLWAPTGPFFSAIYYNDDGDEFRFQYGDEARLKGNRTASCDGVERYLGQGYSFRVTCTAVVEWDLPNPFERKPPETTITGGPQGETSERRPTFTFTSSEPGSTFRCRVGTGTFVPCESPYRTASLPDGWQSFEVYAVDPAQNVDPTPALRTFRVVPPPLPGEEEEIEEEPPPPPPDAEAFFAPRLYFDREERWRPLDVPLFLAEGQHRVCVEDGAECTHLTTVGELMSKPAGWYLDIAGDAGVPSRLPAGSCRDPGLLDCNAGPTSRMYFHHGARPGDTYRYFDYWVFYRMNVAPALGIFYNHEGDWEGVMVAVDARQPDRLEWAAFAQHDGNPHGYSYLSPVLSCDGAGRPGSCTAKSHRVDAYVAQGSHATYPTRCERGCNQSDGVKPEGNYGGQRPWGNNEDKTAVELFPAASWPFWRGVWGSPTKQPAFSIPPLKRAAVEGPGSRPRFNKPVKFDRRARAAGAAADAYGSCDRWFGPSAVASACDPAELRAALDAGLLDEPGGVTLSSPGARAASAPGIAQLVADPLRPGEELTVSGTTGAATTLSVRAAAGGRTVEARFDRLGLERGGSATLRAGSGGNARSGLALRRPDGTTVRPDSVRTVSTPAPRPPARVRARRRGGRLVVTFVARAPRTIVSLPDGAAGRTVRARPGRRARVRLAVPRGARRVHLVSMTPAGGPSRPVVVAIR
jgi:hypothetical protein